MNEISDKAYLNAIRNSFVKGGEEFLVHKERQVRVSLFDLQYKLLTNEIGPEALANISDQIIDTILPGLIVTFKRINSKKYGDQIHRTIKKGTEGPRIKANIIAFRATAKYQIANELDNSSPEKMLFSQDEV